jgi:hypothetical protein
MKPNNDELFSRPAYTDRFPSAVRFSSQIRALQTGCTGQPLGLLEQVHIRAVCSVSDNKTKTVTEML